MKCGSSSGSIAENLPMSGEDGLIVRENLDKNPISAFGSGDSSSDLPGTVNNVMLEFPTASQKLLLL